jgi:hypothetical protein
MQDVMEMCALRVSIPRSGGSTLCVSHLLCYRQLNPSLSLEIRGLDFSQLQHRF